ncbi:hypothetical protein L228DRAFT_269475 [Xylona heveae TC161]|uniref:RSC complex subunit Rsc9 n=1 Tax=Xylona heveae (strain CBS 132557 / TC161) TaxID=1328760 RepID=A0A165FK67_XYLHT|nr:hypothetical protein L228DRAFT_269475 [Xylona heveae TC161]KZF21073.1 hypothetical protein L228DRAFT_269475 [Xylona heveae TC161]
MAPAKGPREPSVERSTEYEEFMEDLKKYHEDRGTTDVFDPEPKIGNRHADLFKLYKKITERGGYDKVSAEKGGFREVGQEIKLVIGPPSGHAQLSYQLKTAYYRNLAAYEIAKFHKKDPPPRNILEDVSARGGDLLNRTLENFQKPVRPSMMDSQDSEGSGDEAQKTPKEEKMDIDEPGSATGRASRGLRQAPPQRVLFQPDVSSTRQTRHATGATHSPQPPSQVNTSLNQSALTMFQNYEPKQPTVLTLRPVITPGNNPSMFQEKQRSRKEAALRAGKTLPPKGMMLPGTGFEGPNIYVRTLLALRSGIPAEQGYALHHLVKISHERGDKYKFEAFPGLAEDLINMVLKVSSLYYNVDWQFSFADEGPSSQLDILDGIQGTKDILERIAALRPLNTLDELETEEFYQTLNKINEAGLVLRNMVTMEENAEYVAGFPQVRDFICIALNLPNRPAVVELQHYALDIAEQITKYLILEADDPLYVSLLRHMGGQDRGAILTALRAISRISMNMEESTRLKGVPSSIIQRIIDWTMLDDEELVHACLDFLYQYTAVVDNVEYMVGEVNVGMLVDQLVRLLTYGGRETEARLMVKPATQPPQPKVATELPNIPTDLLEQLLNIKEPERSSQWLRSCFEEDPSGEITQIALWQAYQGRFAEFQGLHAPLLAAADFIKNVSTTFSSANAQVLNGPVPKFIIKGIRPRAVPMSLQGKPYLRCKWQFEGGMPCGEFIVDEERLWNHLVHDHCRVSRRPDGKLDGTPSDTPVYTCRWKGCKKFSSSATRASAPPAEGAAPAAGGTRSPFEVGMHLKLHLPDSKEPDQPRPEAEFQSFDWCNTAVDERGDAAGLPLTSVLVLRNLARNVPRKEDHEAEGWTQRLFDPVRGRLWHVMAHNRSLNSYLTDLAILVA